MIAMPGTALADEVTCACSVPMTMAVAPIAQLSDVSGNVMVSQEAGFAPAKDVSGLQPGSRVLLGSKASATLTVGQSCTLSLMQNSTATLVAKDQQLCVLVSAPQKAANSTIVSPEQTYGQATDGTQRFGFPEYFFGAAVTATIAGYIFDDKDDDDDQVSR